jgi:hypothetical protein
MLKNKPIIDRPILNLLQQHPNLFPILRQLLQKLETISFFSFFYQFILRRSLNINNCYKIIFGGKFVKKIFIVLLSLIFIGASFTSVTSIKIIGPREAPMPGDLKDGKLPEFPPFLQPAISSHHELYPLTKSDFVVTLIEQLD